MKKSGKGLGILLLLALGGGLIYFLWGRKAEAQEPDVDVPALTWD